MSSKDQCLAVGLMSGTSMDGIDAALVRTDGGSRIAPLAFRSAAYAPAFRARMRGALGPAPVPAELEREFTLRQVEVVEHLLSDARVAPSDVRVVGFHGHTLFHDPAHGRTVQMGDGALLAERLGVDVVADFRSADVAAGGQGAPFAPLFHAAVAPDDRPLCVLNLGGVGNLTWIGSDADPGRDDVFEHLLAFDTGPGCALIDDWVTDHTGQPFDADGLIAAAGTVDRGALDALLSDPYFAAAPPKSLDRNAFDVSPVAGLSLADGAATLTAFTAESVAVAANFLAQPPARWLVTGGGRRNAALMAMLATRLGARVEPMEDAGIDGDAVEAQAFAYLAVRSLEGLPLSGPSTTGVGAPCRGGRLFRAPPPADG